MTSNRIETIRKCLDSLQNLRQNVQCELVIVDTGCNQEMRNIIESYADQIVDFEWCNDFAAARNAGLVKCSGQWFMFIDDDEWFIDTQAIEDFFLSGEYQSYGSANYIVRNYGDLQGTKWNDSSAGRLIRITKDTKFHGKVHEILGPKSGPKKLLDSIAEHYGYVFKNDEERVKHAYRNIVPLQEMIQDEPSQMHWYMQLLVEYLAIQKYEAALDLCEKGLNLLEDKEGLDALAYRGAFQCCLLRVYREKGDYDSVIQLGNEYAKEKQMLLYTRALVFYEISLAAESLNKQGEELDALSKYRELYLKQQENNAEAWVTDVLIIRDAFSEERQHDAWKRGFLLACQINKRDAADYFAEGYLQIDETTIKYDLHEYVLNNQDVTSLLCSYFKDWRDDFETIIYLHILDAWMHENASQISCLLEKYFQVCTDVFKIPNQVWKIVDENKNDVSGVLTQIPGWKLLKYGSAFQKFYTEADWNEAIGPIRKWCDENQILGKLIRVRQDELEITWGLSSEKLQNEKKFACNCIHLFSGIYTEAYARGCKDELPQMLRHAMEIQGDDITWE
jgi:glycosyltransferase involved in cell wall biosynthesis